MAGSIPRINKLNAGGGWPAIRYTFRKAREAGGLPRLWRAMRSRNACKTCALGMGGQKGGMVNEAGHFPEVCKKSLQAMVADMQVAIPAGFFDTYPLVRLKRFTPRELESAGRLTQPMLLKQGESRYQPVSWEDAYRLLIAKLKDLPADQTFWYFSGRSSNEAGFLLQLFARMYGTNNVNNCSFYCHQASGVGLSSVLGSGTGTVQLEDVEHADLVFVIGGNPASNHPRLMTTLKDIRRKGGEVIVINPVIETGMVTFKVPSDPVSLMFGSKIASLYVQPHIGGDLALLTGLAKRIVEMNAHDEPFLMAHTAGWSELKTWLASVPWDEILSKSGLSKSEVDEIALRYSKAKNVVFSWTMGVTHHTHGVENVEAIANLALLRGMVGRPNAGLMPIRGHSNVQGIGSVGVTPKLKDAIFSNLQKQYGITLPTTEGLDTMACMEGAASGALKFGFCLGGNLYGSNPASEYSADALSKLDLLVYLNTTLNTGHAYGLAKETLVLPVLARDEEPQSTTQESMFSYVRLSDGGPARHAGPKSEIEVIATVASGVLGDGGPVKWSAMTDTNGIREMIAATVPGYDNIATIGRTKQEFQIPGRTFHEPTFPTSDGKAHLRTHRLPSLMSRDRSLRLMTVRSEGQFNTVVYEDYDLYRGIERRDVILMHPDDVTRLGLLPEQRVTVCSDEGRMTDIVVRPYTDIRSGNALMYYPEANVLVPKAIDPRSKTPCFKSILIWFEAANSTHEGGLA